MNAHFIRVGLNAARVLMIDGYTFSQVSKKNWYCSRKKKGCKAKVHLANGDAGNLEMTFCDNVHNHGRNEYKQTKEGYYLKL